MKHRFAKGSVLSLAVVLLTLSVSPGSAQTRAPMPDGSTKALSNKVGGQIQTRIRRSAHTITRQGTMRTLLFGAPISLTGATSHEGHLTLEGYQLWVKVVNAHGGIKVGNTRYQVHLKYYDDGSKPTQSAQLMQKLVNTDQVNFLLGPYGTPATPQDEAIAERYQIPMVEANGATKSIFARGFHYIFGVLSPASEYAKVMLEAALALPRPPKTAALIYANDAFSKEVAVAAHDYAVRHKLKVVYYQ